MRMPPKLRLAGEDGEDVGAQRRDPVLHRLLGAAAERHHGDHRAHADDDAQHGEQRPELVGPDRLEGHRAPSRPAASSARLAPAAGWPLLLLHARDGPPPPVIRLIRSCMSCCDCTRLALGSTSTESDAVSPLTTSL